MKTKAKLVFRAENQDQMKQQLLTYAQGYYHQHLAVQLLKGYEPWAAFGLIKDALESEPYLEPGQTLSFKFDNDGKLQWECIGQPKRETNDGSS